MGRKRGVLQIMVVLEHSKEAYIEEVNFIGGCVWVCISVPFIVAAVFCLRSESNRLIYLSLLIKLL